MSEQWVKLLTETGAMQTGHFLLSSGRHSGQYVQCALALQHPENAAKLARALADEITAAAKDAIDCVISPPLGGLVIGYEVARHLNVPFLFPERGEEGRFLLRRGFALSPGTRACIIEDVVTTGRTTREVIELVRNAGGLPAALGTIIDRSADHQIDGIPLSAVLRLSIPTYPQDECPLCAGGIPVVKPGSRRVSREAGP